MRETVIAVSLLFFAILLGVYPESMFGMMRESIDQLVAGLETGYKASMEAFGDSATTMK